MFFFYKLSVPLNCRERSAVGPVSFPIDSAGIVFILGSVSTADSFGGKGFEKLFHVGQADIVVWHLVMLSHA